MPALPQRCSAFLVVLVQILITLVECRSKRTHRQLRFSDCGTESTRPIQFVKLEAHPLPITSPGPLKLSAAINITRTLPDTLAVDIKMYKYFWGIPFRIPCLESQIGSCTYRQVCSYLAIYEDQGCPRIARQHCLPCFCPFKKGFYKVRNLHLRIPKVDGMVGYFAQGDYEMVARIYDEVTQEELGCAKARFTMRKRKKRRGNGGLFNKKKTKLKKIRRRRPKSRKCPKYTSNGS